MAKSELLGKKVIKEKTGNEGQKEKKGMGKKGLRAQRGIKVKSGKVALPTLP